MNNGDCIKKDTYFGARILTGGRAGDHEIALQLPVCAVIVFSNSKGSRPSAGLG